METSQIESSILALEREELAKRIYQIYQGQQQFFKSGVTRTLKFRISQLKKLRQAIRANEALLIRALYEDLRKSEYEAYATELGPVYQEINHAIKHLRTWMQPVCAPTPLMFFPSQSRIYRDPLGIVFCIGPWNYPFLLLMTSVVNAIAGGNTIILKPSEHAPFTADIVTKLIEQNFEESFLAVLQCEGELAGTELIGKYHLDHIFFTGSTRVGKKIMEQAALHLSPVTLELGGKSPCIVDRQANLDYAARKIGWSKLINAGQTCVAPDYLLIHEEVKEAFLQRLTENWRNWLGRHPQESPDYGRLIHSSRYQRQEQYLEQGKIIFGGEKDGKDKFMAPTLLEGVSAEASVMQEEIFGPVMPVITYKTREEAVSWIEKNPYPLSLYVYTSNKETAKFFIENIRFGGGCVNNGIIHLGNPDIPFGGVGMSGLGQYHGKYGFETFTRPKSVMYSPAWFDVPLWYPPYRKKIQWLRKVFMRYSG